MSVFTPIDRIRSRIRLNGTRKRKFFEENGECTAATMNLRFRFELSLDMYNYRYSWHRICLLFPLCLYVFVCVNVFRSHDHFYEEKFFFKCFNVDFMWHIDSKYLTLLSELLILTFLHVKTNQSGCIFDSQ